MSDFPDNYSNTKSDIDYAWQVVEARGYGPEAAVKAGLVMLQAIARNLSVIADEGIELNNFKGVRR